MNKNFPKTLLFVEVFLSVFSTAAFCQSNTLIPFSLEDQFDVSYTDAQYKDYYVILVGGDRKGSDYCFTWSDVIKEKLENDSMKDKIKVLGIADLKAAPTSFRSFIKGKFPKEKKHWVLMDWDGIFAEAYKFQDDVANIIIFNPAGRRIYISTATDVEDNQLNKIFSTLHQYTSL